jgi:hypothetical protein
MPRLDLGDGTQDMDAAIAPVWDTLRPQPVDLGTAERLASGEGHPPLTLVCECVLMSTREGQVQGVVYPLASRTRLTPILFRFLNIPNQWKMTEILHPFRAALPESKLNRF